MSYAIKEKYDKKVVKYNWIAKLPTNKIVC